MSPAALSALFTLELGARAMSLAHSASMESEPTDLLLGELHPLNAGFTWAAHSPSSPPHPSATRTLPFRRLSKPQAELFERDGAVVIDGMFDPAALAVLVSEIDRLVLTADVFNDAAFATRLVTRSTLVRAFCSCEPLTELCLDLIGPDVRLYWDQAVYKGPGETPFPWHQDNGYQFVEPQRYLTLWIALTDATPESGCLWVLPGMHSKGTLRHHQTSLGLTCLASGPVDPAAARGAVPMPAQAGSVVALSSLTPHATGANRSSTVRKAYVVQFAPDGAAMLTPSGRILCRDEAHQFLVLHRSKRVLPPHEPSALDNPRQEPHAAR